MAKKQDWPKLDMHPGLTTVTLIIVIWIAYILYMRVGNTWVRTQSFGGAVPTAPITPMAVVNSVGAPPVAPSPPITVPYQPQIGATYNP